MQEQDVTELKVQIHMLQGSTGCWYRYKYPLPRVRSLKINPTLRHTLSQSMENACIHGSRTSADLVLRESCNGTEGSCEAATSFLKR